MRITTHFWLQMRRERGGGGGGGRSGREAVCNVLAVFVRVRRCAARGLPARPAGVRNRHTALTHPAPGTRGETLALENYPRTHRPPHSPFPACAPHSDGTVLPVVTLAAHLSIHVANALGRSAALVVLALLLGLI